MPDKKQPDGQTVDVKLERPDADLFDPWQRQFTSQNKQSEFRKALEDTNRLK